MQTELQNNLPEIQSSWLPLAPDVPTLTEKPVSLRRKRRSSSSPRRCQKEMVKICGSLKRTKKFGNLNSLSREDMTEMLSSSTHSRDSSWTTSTNSFGPMESENCDYFLRDSFFDSPTSDFPDREHQIPCDIFKSSGWNFHVDLSSNSRHKKEEEIFTLQQGFKSMNLSQRDRCYTH